jgi:hypothetical protein
MKQDIKTLLENLPHLRDNSGELALQYKYSYKRDMTLEMFILDKYESKITRISARLQKEYPELRGEKWLDRQNYSKVKAREYGTQEKPEMLDTIYQVFPEVEIITIDNRPLWKKLLFIS